MPGVTERTRHRLAAAALALLLAALLLGLLEAGLRLAGRGSPPLPSPFTDDPALGEEGSGALPDGELFYRLRPDTQFLGYYRINGLGARGPDVPARRGPGTLRVVCTGDSSTFGLGVPEEAAWPFVLQRLLDFAVGDVLRVEVVDAGVPGYTSLQNRVQIERDLLALAPDALVWMPTGHNDDARVAGRDDAETLEYRRSLLFRLSRLALPRALGLLGDAATPADAGATQDALAADARRRPRVPLPDFEQNLRAVAEACRQAGVLLLLVVPPHSDEVRAARPNEVAAEEIVLRVAGELGVPVTDPRPEFAALAALPLFTDTVHPGADGHAILAWRAFERLAIGREFPWPGRRSAFVSAWVTSHRLGLSQPDIVDALLAPDAPARFRDALLALRNDERDEPAGILAHDPLHGELRGAYGLGRELLLRQEGDPSAADDARLQTLRAHVSPRDDLALLLFEPPSGEVPDVRADAIAAARAVAAADALLRAHPAPRDDRLVQARGLVDSGDADGALALVDQVLALNPRCAEAFEVRGLALERAGDRNAALESFALGSQIEPDSATGLFLLGRTRLQRGDAAGAAASLEHALELDPAHKLARLALVHARLRLDQPDEAERQLRALQRVGAGAVADVPTLEAAIDERRAALAGKP